MIRPGDSTHTTKGQTMTNTNETEYHGRACVDCTMLIANGDTSGNSRCQTEEGEAAYLADVNRHGLHWAIGDEMGFMSGPCSVCGSNLGGDFHEVTGWVS